MTATLSPEELENYVMPRPAKGQIVLWYAHGNPTEAAEVAFVRQVGKRSLTLNVNGVGYDTVRHLTDPKLSLNQWQRASGAWDFPEDHQAKLLPLIKDLQARVESLERQLEAKKASK